MCAGAAAREAVLLRMLGPAQHFSLMLPRRDGILCVQGAGE